MSKKRAIRREVKRDNRPAFSDDSGIAKRLARIDWQAVGESLDERGYAVLSRVLTPVECADLVALYEDDTRFRSRIDMARYRFGDGEYKYFADPLPPVVQALRTEMYPSLSTLANRWVERLEGNERYPDDLASFLDRCRGRGQTKPTPLLLRYEKEGYNCLHQDLYGEVAFPLQMTIVLSRLGGDFTGGEFLLVEQRPRAQSRGDAVTLDQGEAVIFTNRERPVRGSRGYYRVNVRHGVSRLTSGIRYSLGIIFHDAR